MRIISLNCTMFTNFFAYRKSLAKCDFIKLGSDFDVTFQRLEPEKKWPKIPDSTLRPGLTEHLLLLRELNDDLDRMGPASVGNMLKGNRLLEAINEEYSHELADMTKQSEERRVRQYFKDMECKGLLDKRAGQARTLGTESIPRVIFSSLSKCMADLLPYLLVVFNNIIFVWQLRIF